MTHKIRTASSPDELYSNQMLHDELRKGDLFCTPAVFDTSDIHVELKCYAVELQSQTILEDPVSVSRLKRNSNINVYKDESIANMSPTDSVSCESFYSCQSSTSVQEAKNHNQKEYDKLKCDKTNTLKEDFLDQLTMVNALVLGNSVNECLRNKKDKNKCQFTGNSLSKNDVLDNRLPNKYYSGAFTCKINQSDESQLSNTRSKNLTQKKVLFEDEEKLGNNNNKNTREMHDPWSNFKTHNDIQKGVHHEKPLRNNLGESKFVFVKKKPTSLRLKQTANIPNNTIAKIGSYLNKTKKPDVVEEKYLIEHYKQKIVKGCEFIYVAPSNQKLRTTYVYPEQSEPESRNRMLYGDGNIVFKKIPNSYQQINKYFLADLGDSQIKTLISQSLQKLHTESKEVSQFCVSLSCKRKATNVLTYNTTNTEDHFNNVIDLTNQLKFTSSETYLNCPEDSNKESARITEITNVDDVNYCNFDYLLPAKSERSKSKRKASERKPILPVIEEESIECLESVSSEENVTDECCLTDRLGNPISLFDSQGLPLTDSCGRPLRYANGQLMMKCDKDGLPIIDDETCDIRDMFGRRPHEELFDPSVKPKSDVHNKLFTHDGKPLLLFDTEGRPLTSVSGTMLVDCSGRGLVRLNTSDY